MKVAAAAGVAFFVLATVGSAAVGGLRGIVTRGPTQPVCRAGRTCSAPAAKVKLVFRRLGVVRTVTTDGKGHYRISLAAGAQSVSIAGTRFGYRPRTVVVPAGRVGVQNFSIDTGIR